MTEANILSNQIAELAILGTLFAGAAGYCLSFAFENINANRQRRRVALWFGLSALLLSVGSFIGLGAAHFR